ncbi:MAG TPA: ribbon-helix-helix domain-containing protein [Acetobacteraceae bacterium]|nr:ribbon-helix-helix domain-containing protein [Acetobacteraceae bacterium]
MARSRLVNRNVVAGSGRTSMRLEPELWDALAEICEREGRGIHDLIRGIDGQRERGGRTSAVRVFVVQYFRAAATEAGHMAAGHGPSCSVAA